MLKNLITRLGQPQSAPPWGLGTALAAVIAAFAALILGTSIAFALLGNAPFVLFAGWVIGCLLITAFVGFTRRSPAQRAALLLTSFNTSLFLLLFISLGVAIALDIINFGDIARLALLDPQMLPLVGLQPDLITWIFAALFVVLAQPIAEELIFRGIALPSLRHTLGAWLGLLLCALMYGIFHVLIYPPSIQNTNSLWYGFALPFLSGLYFSAVRVYTGSTRAAIAAHMVFGLFTLLKALLALG